MAVVSCLDLAVRLDDDANEYEAATARDDDDTIGDETKASGADLRLHLCR